MRVAVHSLLAALSLAIGILAAPSSQPAAHNESPPTARPPSSPRAIDPNKVHVLIPVTDTHPNLCRSLLTYAINGWPRPTLVAWAQKFDDPKMLHGGSHLGKITGVLDWIGAESERLKATASPAAAAAFEDELVAMLDGYDMWVQLPVHVFVSRFETLLRLEDRRIALRMGRAAEAEGVRAKVVFGASKRCGPNKNNTIACYPIPESPLPADLFGPGTDTDSGFNAYAHVRQRYLVAGFAVGRVRDIRATFQEAHRRMKLCLAEPPSDDDKMYICHRGSDQSLFTQVWGHQEFHREVMRRHHRTEEERLLEEKPQRLLSAKTPGGRRPVSTNEGQVIDDPLNPSFPHEEMDETYLPGQPFEYGITVDYFSSLTHSTSNAIWDAGFVDRPNPYTINVAPVMPDRPTNCTHLTIPPADFNVQAPAWRDLPMYTELCTGSVPAVVHLNDASWKRRLGELWPRTWWYGRARRLLDQRRRKDGPLAGGARTDTGADLSWDDLCPAAYDEEVFGR
jgi:hypothetical protein